MLNELVNLHMSIWGLLARVAIALACGALIGWERELKGRAAGLRTHMLVALGSAGFTLIGLEFIAADSGENTRGGDALRIIEAIATGVGFLGAGAIMQSGREVKGLTTAASVWLVAAVGLAAGAGFWILAVIMTVLGFITLSVLFRVAPDATEAKEKKD